MSKIQAAPGLLEIGGVAATDLTNEFGAPLYAYDAEFIRRQYRRLTEAFSGFPHQIHYAMKANNNIHILRLLREEGAALDAVAVEEVEIGLRAGFEPGQILFTPNCVSFAEIEHAVDLGVQINIDNLEMLEAFGHAYGNAVPVCVRINPHIYAGGNSHIQTGHIDSKFGISIHQLRHILRIVRSYDLRVEGLHMHTGSDILDAEVFLQAAEVLLNAAFEFEHLRYLDFGSGFKVAYKSGDVVTNVEELGAKLAERLTDFYAEYGRELEIWFEPGKFLVSEAGYFLVEVNVVKQTVSNVFLGVNSGLNHLIRPMLYDAYHEVVNASKLEGPTRVYSVVGYICETDTFATDRQLPETFTGDILAFKNAGAYCMTMASNYNSRRRPAEVLVDKGEAKLIRRAETLEDLLALQLD
jgi:diaminopimelate decarboxylase